MASVVVTMDARERALMVAMDKLIQKQAQVNKGFEDGEKKSKRGGDTAAKSFSKLAMQYVSLQAAMQVVNNMSAEFARLQDASLQKTKELAASQTDAIKNLQGLTYLQKKSLMTTDVEGIQKKTGFPSRAMLSDAIGAGISAGGTPEEVLSAVEAAARLNINTPEKMQTTAAGAIDMARATGIREAEKNLGLLLTTGSVSRVESSDKLANSLGKTIGSTMSTVPDSDRELAGREAAALFSVLNKAANDKQGEPTATATTSLAIFLRKLVPEVSTLSGRLEKIANDEGLRAEFLKQIPGEAAFKIPMEMLVTKGSAAFDEFKDNATKKIAFSTDAFRENVDQLQNMTPQLSIATASAAARAATEAYDSDQRSSARAAMGEIASNTLPRVRSGGIFGVVQSIVENTNAVVTPNYLSSPESFAAYTKQSLAGRRSALESGGVTAEEQVKVDLIDQAITSINQILKDLAQSTESMSNSAATIANSQGPARAQAAGAAN